MTGLRKYYDQLTMDALDGSIEKWEGVVAGDVKQEGSTNCVLCQHFLASLNGDCFDCPVSHKVGKSHCSGTPYDNTNFLGRYADTPERRRAALKELDFLKDLKREIETGVSDEDEQQEEWNITFPTKDEPVKRVKIWTPDAEDNPDVVYVLLREESAIASADVALSVVDYNGNVLETIGELNINGMELWRNFYNEHIPTKDSYIKLTYETYPYQRKHISI